MISLGIRTLAATGRRHRAGAIAALVSLSLVGLTGCGVVNTVRKVTHALKTSKATVDAFTKALKSGESTTFVATYETTGTSPTTVVYAVKPPMALSFTTSSAGAKGAGSALDIVVNPSGEYSCSRSSSGTPTHPTSTCRKLGVADAASENKIFAFYTPAHWIAFLKGFALTAALAGDSVTSSTMTLNGFGMQCVDFHAPGVPGTSTICTTAQGILGYVKVASNTTRFELQRYSASPPASLFELPPGAKVTTP